MANSEQDVRSLKRALTLDLEPGAVRNTRRKNLDSNFSILTSPDVNRLALASPEVERMLNTGVVQTPISTYLMPSNVTERQKAFAAPLVQALQQLKDKDSSLSACEPPPTTETTTLTALTCANVQRLNTQTMNTTSSTSNYSSDAGNSDTNDSMPIKDEQTVPGSHDQLPIDMRDQEKLKLERKRLRNRIAASKCRKKKLQRIAELEDQVNNLKKHNSEYEKMISMLKNEVGTLRHDIFLHKQQGCQVDV